MMNQMNLPSFNPLNIVNNGNKVQHPTAGYSNTISQNVEGMHKEFHDMHKNLKNLVMLYKTRHQLMESLNENGLYTAKCYNEMFDNSPLEEVVAPGEKHRHHANEDREETVEQSGALAVVQHSFEESVFVANSPSQQQQSKTFQYKLSAMGNVGDDGIDMIEYPDSGVIREKLDPDEGSHIGKKLSRNIHTHQEPDGRKKSPQKSVCATSNRHPNQEPEGIKASKKMSVAASDTSYLQKVTDSVKDYVVEESRGSTVDPPTSVASTSDNSVAASSSYDRKERTSDPPTSQLSFPDDELSVGKYPDSSTNIAINDKGGSMNVIVDDDDDSFVDAFEAKKTIGEVLASEDDKNKSDDKELAIRDNDSELNKTVTDLVVVEDKKEELVIRNADEDGHEFVSFRELSNTAPAFGEVSIDGDTSANDEKNIKGDTDGEPLVIKATPENESLPPPSPNSTTSHRYRSYFDVHKAAYKEMNAKLDEHTKLVDYVEQWSQTVVTRVQSRYYEYVKHRNSLNHYAKKMDALNMEVEKLKEKNKPLKPKQKEKVERNQVKLTGSLETHDKAGEELLMLMDEVIFRSWKDAFPLLKRSISFEMDFASIQEKHMSNLVSSLDLLEDIGKGQSILMEGRIEDFQKKNPEDVYTGARDKVIFTRED